jgi:hypothetical protein
VTAESIPPSLPPEPVRPSEVAAEPSLLPVEPPVLVTAVSTIVALLSELVKPSETVAEPSLLPAEPPELVTAVSTIATLPSELVGPSETSAEPSLLPLEPPVLETAESIPAVLPSDLAEAASALPSLVCAPSFLAGELEQAVNVAAANRTNARFLCIRRLVMVVDSSFESFAAFADNTCTEAVSRCTGLSLESGVLLHEATAKRNAAACRGHDHAGSRMPLSSCVSR